ncbi:MAG TPA: hypothetical protein VEI97_03775, partial [bacterium]|nr:hypothetical protein [bacterium]
ELPRLLWIALGVLYFAVRLPALYRFGFDLDEAVTATLAHRPWPAVLGLVRAEDMHPPLFPLLLAPLRWLTADDAILRALPLLLGFGALGATVRLARRIGGPWPGYIAGVLFALSPYAIQHTTLLRLFALAAWTATAAFDAALAWWTGDGLDRGGRWRYALWMAAAAYTFYLALPVWLAVALVGLFVVRGGERWRWIGYNALAAALFLPWVPALLAQWIRLRADRSQTLLDLPAGEQWAAIQRAFLKLPNALFTWMAPIPDPVARALWIALPVLMITGLVLLRRQSMAVPPATEPLQGFNTPSSAGAGGGLPAAILLALTVYLALALIGAVYLPRNVDFAGRYFIVVVPALWAILATSYLTLPRPVGLAALAVLLALDVAAMVRPVRPPVAGFREAAHLLQETAAPGAPVWVIARFCEIPLEHYWPEGAVQIVGQPDFRPMEEASVSAVMQQLRLLDQAGPPPEIWMAVSHNQRGRSFRGGWELTDFLEYQFGPPTGEWQLPGVELYRFAWNPQQH